MVDRTAPHLTLTGDRRTVALVALVAGAVAMGLSPVFIRNAGVGPFASAFWRVALALPALWLWSYAEGRTAATTAKPGRSALVAIVCAGLFFAADLSFWHLAILHTTIANATFLGTLAPVCVVLGSGLFLGEKVGSRIFAGLALCLLGAAALIGTTMSVRPENLDGDIYGLITAVFFGAYFIAMRRARRIYGTGRSMFLSSLVTAAVLLVEALLLEPAMWPAQASGVAALFAVALISHAGGQGLLSFALGHLPAAFSSLVTFLEAVAAALFAWVFVGEALGLPQGIGAAAIFAGIAVATPRQHR